MATFHSANGRLSFYMEILAGGHSRHVKVTDDGWQIRLKDDDGKTLYVFCPPNGEARRSDKDSALKAIQAECGWWASRQDLFQRPPKAPGDWPLPKPTLHKDELPPGFIFLE
jgi:hypothetical protein